MAWRVARSLTVLRNQLDEAWPGRNTASDGTIGDAAHTSTSDHAAKDFPGWGNDIVTARDITHDPGHGADMLAVAEALRTSQDGRIKYVIWGNRMYSSYSSGGVPPWNWRGYTGEFHYHLHVSVVGDPRADGEQPWAIGHTPQEDDMALTPAQNNALAEAWAILVSLRDGAPVGPVDTHPGGQNQTLVKLGEIAVDAAAAAGRTIALTAEDRAAIVEQLATAIIDRLGTIVPSIEDVQSACKEAVDARMSGATIQTAP